jgi:hypothetical protein
VRNPISSRIRKDGLIRIAAAGLLALFLTDCVWYREKLQTDVPKSVTVTGKLVCCNEGPAEYSTGYYVDLYSPLEIEDGIVSVIEIVPAYRFQLETLADSSGSPVEISGVLKKSYSFEEGKWVFFVQVVSIEDVSAP